MQNTFVMVVVGWLAMVSLIFAGYLAALMIEERRRHRRVNTRRQRIGASV